MFKIEVTDTGSRTEIKAKVWADGTAEPAGWQIDAWDDSANRLTHGKIGVWSYSSGSKYWDDFKVESQASFNQPPTPPEPVPDPDLPASITSHPQSKTVTEGDAATFAVTASGTGPISYQWQRRNGTVWINIAGATGPSYTIADTVFSDDNGASFRCRVSNAVSPSGVYSNQALLTVVATESETGLAADYFDTDEDPDTSGDFESFDDYGTGSDPAGWLDTGARNSMAANDALFKTYDVGGRIAFGTTSTLEDIHSHNTSATYDATAGFVFTGRMRMSASNGGIGVTFLSDYPNSDTYYRLRRYSSNAFHLAPHPHGTVKLSGDTDSGVVPAPNTWYQFKIEVADTGSRTEIRAKVWADGTTEPAGWQIDAWDDSANRLTHGKIGVWSYSSGSKYWDDLSVTRMSP